MKLSLLSIEFRFQPANELSTRLSAEDTSLCDAYDNVAKASESPEGAMSWLIGAM